METTDVDQRHISFWNISRPPSATSFADVYVLQRYDDDFIYHDHANSIAITNRVYQLSTMRSIDAVNNRDNPGH